MSYDVIASQPIVVDNVSCAGPRQEGLVPQCALIEIMSASLPNPSSPRDLALLKQVLLGKITQRFTSTASESTITEVIRIIFSLY